MTKLLNGRELAEFIKERQARQVRALRQAHHIFPRLAIIVTTDNPVIATYVRLKQSYGADILVDVDVHTVEQAEVPALIEQLNADAAVYGIIVQLPLSDPTQTDAIVKLVAPEKDVDALGEKPDFDAGTAQAINWLLAGYNVELVGKRIVIVGNGRLVGAPLARLWRESGYDITVLDDSTTNNEAVIREADIVVTAVGKPGLITRDMLKKGAVVVDAATTNENGRLVGDVEPSVRERDDLTITPEKGGVGPLTIVAIFDHIIEAALKQTT